MCGGLCMINRSIGLKSDDIKFYAKSKQDIGFTKCDWMVNIRGRIVRTEGVSLPYKNFTDIEDSNKNPGIAQVSRNLKEAT